MFQKQQFVYGGEGKNTFSRFNFGYLLFLFVLGALCLMWQNPLLSQEVQEKEKERFTITLKSRKFIPQAGIEKNVLAKLQTVITQEKRIPHIIVQFKKTPSRSERECLKARGVKLISPIGGRAWYASLSDISPLLFVDPKALERYPTLNLIRWIGEIRPEDKIDTKIIKFGFGSYAKNPDGTVNVIIKFFKDVSKERASTILEKYGSNIKGPGILNDWRVTLREEDIRKIAAEDEVQYIEEVPPPEKDHNDCSRFCANVDPLQVAPYNLDGNNVQVGEWDGGEIGNHPDLAGRVTIIETGNVSDHATHVAGTLAGDGSQSAADGGAPNQWRGVATQVDLFSYTYLVTDLEPEEHDDAINVEGIDISQNSWGLNLLDHCPPDCPVQIPNDNPLYGDYRTRTAKYDDIVAGEYGTRIPIVFAAGNDQRNVTGSYGSITPPGATSKNTITVGSINCDAFSMTNTSSWGPTDDGRIKPDVVAPGCERGGDMGVNSTIPNLFIDDRDRNCALGVLGPGPNTDRDDYCFPYDTMCGTSMAAPIVSGTIALMIQQYRRTFFDNDNVDNVPLPSTLKALLIHSARDLWLPPGPDFRFGYGLIDAQGAVDLIRARDRMIESQTSEENEEDIFLCDVPAGEAEFNVTLVWDDPPGTVGAADILVNDLDLELQDPNGDIHEPWILDPANPVNAATTGEDHVNNVEQVHANNPVAGLWRIRIRGYEINEPIQKYSLVSDFPFYESESVSVVQVIDRTGSMNHRDTPSGPTYMESAKISAQNFIGLMQLGDEVGVVAFDDQGCDNIGTKAEAKFNLAEITTETVRNNAISAIEPLDDRGCTSIGAGMQLAQDGPNFLDAATADQPHSMVLLTDGFQNTPPWVRERPANFSYKPATPDNILLTIPSETDIYTIALGPHADSDLMKDIANTTGGKFYESPTILGLLSIYYQIQGDLQLGEMADLETGTQSGGNETRIVTIDSGTSEATFVVGWLQKEGDLKLTLKDPNVITITPNRQNVKEGHGSTYYFLRIKDPLPGDWEVHILRTDSGDFQIDYTFATFVKGVSKLWSFIPDLTWAGDCLMTKVKLYDNRTLNPITGASVQAIISSPQTYKYTLNYNYVKPTAMKWNPKSIFSTHLKPAQAARAIRPGDQLPTWSSTLRYYDQKSLSETGKSIFQYDVTTIALYDDGTHGDEQAGDGTYTNCIDKTQIAGSYSIRFSISGVTPSGANFKRKMLSTATIKPGQVDAAKTLVRVDPSVIDVPEGSEGIITIVPMDGFGNVWGPGFASKISVTTTAGALSGGIVDNGDGFYFQTIKSTGVEGVGRVTVTIDGVEMDTKPVVTFTALKYPFSVSIHSGIAIPRGAFANDFDRGLNILLNVDYHFSPQLSLVGIFGYNKFKSKSATIDDTYWINLSANIKYRLRPGTLSPYICGGPGYYIPETGSNAFGANLGIGVNYDYSSHLTLEVGLDYHKVFGRDVQFLHTHAGVIFRF